MKFTLNNADGGSVINTEYLDGFQYSTPNTEPLRLALQQADESTTSAVTASEAEAFTALADRAIAAPIAVIPGTPAPEEPLILSFFPTAEGYYDYENMRYIYQYKDQLGNVRLSFTKNKYGVITMLDRNDYYPFGMSFLKTGLSAYDPMAIPYNYKFQGQELQETGFYSFKWRNYMPDVGRFFNVDKLSEQFPYNSVYAFQENKIGLGRELEGLELVPFDLFLETNLPPPNVFAETGIREVPIEGVTLVGKATPPPEIGLLERIWNGVKNWVSDLFGNSSKPETTQSMNKTVENAKPETTAEQPKPENTNEFQKPDNWETKETKSPGVEHKDPNNPRNSVREMKGNKNSPNPAQQKDYIKYQKEGTLYDKNGQPTKGGDTPESHIPKTEFDQSKMPQFN